MKATQNGRKALEVQAKQRWEPMKLTYVGHIGQIVQGGGGKLSLTGGDPGDFRKPTGQG